MIALLVAAAFPTDAAAPRKEMAWKEAGVGRGFIIRSFITVGALALGGCSVLTDDQSYLTEDEKFILAKYPMGSFSIVAAQNSDGVYVLDTTEGTVRYCATVSGEMTVVCGSPGGQ